MAQNLTTSATFIPELWRDEFLAFYEANTPMRRIVTVIPHQGKRGDVIHIPAAVDPGDAVLKADNEADLQIDTVTFGEVQIQLNKVYQKSRRIEDIVEIQALDSHRQAVLKSIAYPLAKAVEKELHALGTGLQGGTYNTSGSYNKAVIGGDGKTLWNPAANTNAGNGSAITEAGLRQMIQTLDDADVPLEDRYLVIPPVAKNSLLATNRFTEYQTVGDGSALRSGNIGQILGLTVHVSSLCPEIAANDGTTKYRVGLVLHKDAFVLAEQKEPVVTAQYYNFKMAHILVAYTVFGVAEQRDNGGVAFVVPK